MSRAVYLHIGAPKTGTTYVQDRLELNARSLARHDVHLPTRPLVSPGLFHFRAALDLLGQDWGGPPGHAEGGWDAMVRRARRSQGSVIISHEILATATAGQVAQALDDLADREVHVVYSARDLGPAAAGGLAGEHQAGPHLVLPALPEPDRARGRPGSSRPSTCRACWARGARRCRPSGCTW